MQKVAVLLGTSLLMSVAGFACEEECDSEAVCQECCAEEVVAQSQEQEFVVINGSEVTEQQLKDFCEGQSNLVMSFDGGMELSKQFCSAIGLDQEQSPTVTQAFYARLVADELFLSLDLANWTSVNEFNTADVMMVAAEEAPADTE